MHTHTHTTHNLHTSTHPTPAIATVASSSAAAASSSTPAALNRCGAGTGQGRGNCTRVSTSAPPAGYHPYTLTDTWEVSPDSRVLRFALPGGVDATMGAPLPSCLKVHQEVPDPSNGGAPVALDKSYSPVSLPEQKGFFELLVKGYPPRPVDHHGGHGGMGGLGAFLVDLRPGEAANMKVKAPRMFHGLPYVVASGRVGEVVGMNGDEWRGWG